MKNQPRAKTGGEYGPNGEFYTGGAFIATTELSKKERKHAAQQQKELARKVLIAPFEGAVRPSLDRKSTRLNSSHVSESRMPSSA